MKSRYLIIIVLMVNIFGITIPYSYKNNQTSHRIEIIKNSTAGMHENNKEALTESDYYDLIRILNDTNPSHALDNTSTDISLIEEMIYRVTFSGDKHKLKKYVLFLDTLDDEIVLQEALLNFNEDQPSNITLISR